MAVLYGGTIKDYLLNALRDGTDGLNFIELYDDEGAQVGDIETIGFGSPVANVSSMTQSEITFTVPSGTVVAGFILGNFDGSTTYTTFITYNFDQQYTYNNAGSFVVTDITITIGG